MRVVATYAFEPSDCPFNRNRVKEITAKHHQGAIDARVKGRSCWQTATWEPGDNPDTIVVTADVTSVDKFLGVDGLLGYSVWNGISNVDGEFVTYRLLRVVIEDP